MLGREAAVVGCETGQGRIMLGREAAVVGREAGPEPASQNVWSTCYSHVPGVETDQLAMEAHVGEYHKLSNRPQVSITYKLINQAGYW